MNDRIRELEQQIEYYNSLYYDKGISEISDAEYDRLYDEYVKLTGGKGKFTKEVGHESSTVLPKFTHKTPLLSIDRKSKELDAVKDWYEKIGSPEVIVEPKFDGITCNINYEEHILQNAATRGNGYIGDLITDNFRNTDTVYPEKVDGKILEVRGEAIIPYTFFIKNLSEDYSNPRNAVSGIMRQINPEEIKGKGVQVIFYDIGHSDILNEKDSDNVEMLKKEGFRTSPYFIAGNWEELKKILETKFNGKISDVNGFNTMKGFDGMPDPVCDGVVIKVNSLALREEIGFSDKGPKWAFAMKFKPLRAESEVVFVDWQVGKTGKVTPVANFNAVSLGGTVIRRATLNNYDYMSKLPTVKADGELDMENTTDLRYGDTIIIERSNDVIPRIVAVKKHAEGGAGPQSMSIQLKEAEYRKTFREPETCPVCGSPLVKEGPLHFCNNYMCGMQVRRRVEHFACRDAMNIVSLGESVAECLFENGNIKTLSDIYRISRDDLLKLEAFKDKKADKLLKAIEDSRKPELNNFIYSLSIDNVGKRTAKDLAKKYRSFSEFRKATKESLLEIADIGETVADAIIRHLDEHSDEIDSLLEFVEPKNIESGSEKLKGQTFVITGKLENPREYYEKIIEGNGGTVSGSVSAKTKYLLLGTDAGSKEKKARDLIAKGAGIIILDTEEKIAETIM